MIPLADEIDVKTLLYRHLMSCFLSKLFPLSTKKTMSDFASTANVSMLLLGICTYTYLLDCPLAECTSCIANIVALFTIKPLLKRGEDSTKMKILLKNQNNQIKRYLTTEYYCSASVYICKIKWKKNFKKNPPDINDNDTRIFCLASIC